MKTSPPRTIEATASAAVPASVYLAADAAAIAAEALNELPGIRAEYLGGAELRVRDSNGRDNAFEVVPGTARRFRRLGSFPRSSTRI